MQRRLMMNGATTGWPKLILQAEGAALLGVAVLAYAQTGAGWGMFALLFLVPDVAMLGYLHGPRLGAMVYNLGHSTVGPLALCVTGWVASPMVWGVGVIWLGHIGFDRMLGYGLKYGDAFGHSHLSGQAVTTHGVA
jgi:Domain of unknown function (DUF4260)